MGGLSIWHWIIVGAVVFILFGGKFKISDVMGDVAKGIKAFKKGMSEDDGGRREGNAKDAAASGGGASRRREVLGNKEDIALTPSLRRGESRCKRGVG